MRTKNIISFVLVVAIIAALAFVALADVQIGNIEIPSTFDREKGIKQGLDLVGGAIIVFQPDQAELKKAGNGKVTEANMEAAREVIRNRANDIDSEATVSRQGKDQIRVEIPDFKSAEAAAKTMGQTAKLEFVDADGKVIMDGSDKYIKKAKRMYGKVNEGSNSENYVELTLTSEGRKVFRTATAAAAARSGEQKNYIAICLDGKEKVRPMVHEEIDSKSCVITGNYKEEDAEKLASLINSGKLPFSMEIASTKTVGPTLGARALSTSLKSALIGIILVMLFMLLVYRLPGFIADISLVAYIAVVTLIMAGFFVFPSMRVTLTLPGVAGVILSIGMAVDANVVIFERIKDELRKGKSVGAAVESGFSRAFTAVVDSNITTIIAAVVLYVFGSGTVQGFAVTLFIGIVISMLTAITLTKFLLRRMVGLGIKNPLLYGISKRRDA